MRRRTAEPPHTGGRGARFQPTGPTARTGDRHPHTTCTLPAPRARASAHRYLQAPGLCFLSLKIGYSERSDSAFIPTSQVGQVQKWSGDVRGRPSWRLGTEGGSRGALPQGVPSRHPTGPTGCKPEVAYSHLVGAWHRQPGRWERGELRHSRASVGRGSSRSHGGSVGGQRQAAHRPPKGPRALV